MAQANDREVMRKIVSQTTGKSMFFFSGYHPFCNLEPLTDGTIADLTPASYDGAYPNDIDQGILAELDFFVRPLEKEKTPVLPKFFTEFEHMKDRHPCQARNRCASYS